ncbi:hypothetical protein [Saccharothrix lopnurensis]|uniref:hypothetical protein n=1 Tax=Saccharothrix lopnurensis TaxID=1670621 RepID=UPI003A97C2EA
MGPARRGLLARPHPGGRLLRRSARPAHLPAVFAADFSLSHACRLLCYPLAGVLATATTTPVTLGGRRRHTHAYRIDEFHTRWPTTA